MQGMTTTDIEEKGIDPAPPIVETRDLFILIHIVEKIARVT